MKQEEAVKLVLAVSNRSVPYNALKVRGNDVLVARTAFQNPESVIVKLWNRPDWKGALRRYTKTNIAWKEWTTLQAMQRAKILCPTPFAYVELGKSYQHTEAIVMSDLGDCGDATETIKKLLRELKTEERSAFEGIIISTTAKMIRMGLIDIDHRLPNFVVSKGKPIRLDFELTKKLDPPEKYPKQLGLMLGTLIGSYVFAVQPNTKLAENFAKRLLQATKPTSATVDVAHQCIQEMLLRQKNEIGMDTVFNLKGNP